MTTITEKQNQPSMIKLLRARKGVYKRLKCYQGFYLTLTLALPVASYVFSQSTDRIRAVIALTAIVIGLLDALLFDRWQKQELKIAAKLQEEFDCELLGMPWNSFVVGPKVSPEDTNAYARVKLSKKGIGALNNWYPESADPLPLPLATLVCQRASLWYDGKLRKAFLVGLTFVGTVVVVGALFASTAANVSLTSLVLAAVPAVPFLTWAAHECARQKSTIDTINRLRDEIESLWDRLSSSGEHENVTLRARELQDAIFNHRASSPLIFDWIYRLLRRRFEEDMRVGADCWIADLSSVKKGINS